jgi:PAS domain S-box-containing protein
MTTAVAVKRSTNPLKPVHIALVAVAMAFIALGICVFALVHEHEEEAAFATAGNLTRVIAERLEATLRRADNDVRLFVQFLPPDAMQPSAASRYRKTFEAQFRAKLDQFPEILSRNVVDADGNSLYRVGNSGPRSNYADRDWFKTLRDNPQVDNLISDVVSSRISDKPTIVIAYAVRDRTGRFLGSANATINLEVLDRMLKSLDVGVNGRIVVRRTGGENKLVLRYPASIGDFNSTAKTQTSARIEAGETYGRFKTVSPIDGMELATAFRMLDGFPFSISVGLAQLDYLKEWRQMALIAGGAGCALFVLLLLFVIQRARSEARLANLAVKLKLGEVALQASNQFLHDVLESSSDGILVEDTNGIVLATNRRFHAMWQVPDVIAGQSDRSLLNRHMALLLVNPTELPTMADTADGRDIVNLRPLELRDGRQIEPDAATLRCDGELAGRVWSFHDVTERKRVRRMYRSIIESSADAFVAFDAELRVTNWSPRAEKIFGVAADVVAGRSLAATILPEADAADGTVQKMLAAVRAGNTDAAGRVQRVTALRLDKTEFPAEIQISGFKMGDEWEYTSFIRDISTRLLAEEHLAQSQKFEAIGQLTGGLAHDFNNILGIVIGSLDLLEVETADNRELRDAALAAARRGSDVTKSLLAVARRKTNAPQRVGLDDLLHEILPLLQQTTGKRIKLDFKAGSAGSIVQIDPGGFSNVMLNLVINARDAMPEGGELCISTIGISQCDDDQLAVRNLVSVKVTDTGCGMTPEVAERAFDPFFTTKVRGKGTGLGLATAYAFARQSGGSASLTSAPGAGTTIELLLPAHTMVAGVVAVAAQTPELRGRGELVMLVDDELDLARVGSQWLTALGYRVVMETNSQRALARLVAEPFDALVSDVIMPGALDGVTLAERATRQRPGLAVVLVSGYADTMLDGIKDRFDLLDKPFTKQQLGSALRSALERSRASMRRAAPYPHQNAA